MPALPLRPRTLVPALAAAALLAGAGMASAAPPDVTLGFAEPVGGTIANTGFTTTMAGSTVLPGNLNMGGGALSVVTTQGDAFPGNNQDNALGVTFDGSDDYRVAATLRGPLQLTGGSQGAGVYIGTGQDSYVKIIAGRTGTGTPRIQMRQEGGTGGTNGVIDKTSGLGGFTTAARIDLTLEYDADENEIEGSYSINGGPNTKVGTMTLPGLGDTNDQAGIISTSAPGGPPTSFFYDAFVVEPKVFLSFEPAQTLHTFANIGGDPQSGKQYPTSVAVGPSGRLYVAGQYGRIHILQRDANDNTTYVKQLPNIFDTPNQTFNGGAQPSEKGRLVTGIAVAPGSTAANQVIYVSHSDPQIFEAEVPGQSTVYPASGRVTKLVLNAANNVVSQQDMVVGLPRSAENHAPNGMAFGPDGWLYLGIGGNTNAGDQSVEFGYFPETPLSGSVVRLNPAAIGAGPPVDVTPLSTFQFTDPCGAGETPGNGCSAAANVPRLTPSTTGPTTVPGADPAKFQLFATGFRNPYDLVWHSNGTLYGNENEHNDEFGQTAGSTSSPQGVCPGNPQNPGTPPDHLERIQAGEYHGHQNPSRGECAFNGGTQPIADYSVSGLPSASGARSATSGIAEYTSNALPLLQGQLISASYVTGELARVQLNPAGTSAEVVELATGFSASVDVAVTENGNIIVAELTTGGGNGGRISILRPDTSEAGCFLGEAVDSDGDGYSDMDEIDNRSQRCNAASKPSDFDGDGISDLNDPDDDNDGILDVNDPFQRDRTNGRGTALPFVLGFNTSNAGGWYGTGFGGIQLSSKGGGPLAGLVAAGGAGGYLGVSATPGTAEGAANTQNNALQQGFDARAPWTSSVVVGEPFGADGPQGGAGTSLFFGPGEDAHVKISVRAVNGAAIIQLTNEQGGAVTEIRRVALPLPAASVRLFLTGQPGSSSVVGQYQVGAGALQNLGTATVPAGWFAEGAATGIMSTSQGAAKAGFVYDEFRIEAGGAVSTQGPGAVPTAKPRKPGVVINNGRRYTNRRAVTLRITPVDGATRVRISPRASLRGKGTKTVTLKRNGLYKWTLPAAAKPYSKRVYIRFIGPGVGTRKYADAIVLDRVKPVLRSAALVRVRGKLRLQVQASDRISKVASLQVKRGGKKPAKFVRFTRSRPLTVAAGTRVQVRVRDGAGNVSRWVTVARR